MALTVDAEQLTMANRSSVECLPLVKLETFTNRDAQTVASTRYWTRTGRAVVYKWDGTNNQTFEPVLDFVTPIDRGFSHLPDSSEYNTRDTVRLEVSGGPLVGEYLWKALLSENIVGARVTIGSVLIDPAQTSHDLGFTNSVHVYRWRGEVTLLTDIRAEGTGFTLVCESIDAKLSSSIFVPGASSGDLPVILDATTGLNCLATSVRYQGTITSRNPASGTLVSFGVTFEGEAPEDGGSSSNYPVTWTKPSPITFDNIWYIATYAAVTNVRDLGWYEQVNNPGAAGAPEVDFLYPQSVSDADVGNLVRVGKWPIKFAIGGGYVRGVSRLLIESAINQIDPIDAASSSLDNRFYLSTDRTDPHNPISYANFIPTTRFNVGGQVFNALLNHEDITMTADVSGAWETPSGNWTDIVDPTTWNLAVSNTATYGGEQYQTSSGPGQSGVYYTQFSTTAATDIVVQLLSGSLFLYSTYPSSTGPSSFAVNFRGISPGVGDKQFEVTINVSAGQLTKLQRIHLSARRQTTLSERLEIRGRGGDGYRLIKNEEIVSGSNTFTFECAVPDIATDEIYELMILCDWNDNTSNHAISFPSPIRARSLNSIAAANHPTDAVTTIVESYLPGGGISIDATTFAAAKANTPNLAVTPDLSRYPSLGEILAAIGFAGRANFVYGEESTGTVLKAFAAETDYDFPAPIRAIGNVFAEMKITLRPITEIANAFSWLYDLTRGNDEESISGYASSLRATQFSNPYPNIPDSEFSSSASSFGVREAIEIPIPMIRDETTALDVTAYYVNESLRGQVARYSCLVPYWIGYDLEPGDIVSIQPSWETTAVKVRVVRVVFSFDSHGIGLVLESVT